MSEQLNQGFERFCAILREVLALNTTRPMQDQMTIRVVSSQGRWRAMMHPVIARLEVEHPTTRRMGLVDVKQDGSMSEESWIRGQGAMSHSGMTLTNEDPAEVARRILDL